MLPAPSNTSAGQPAATALATTRASSSAEPARLPDRDLALSVFNASCDYQPLIDCPLDHRLDCLTQITGLALAVATTKQQDTVPALLKALQNVSWIREQADQIFSCIELIIERRQTCAHSIRQAYQTLKELPEFEDFPRGQNTQALFRSLLCRGDIWLTGEREKFLCELKRDISDPNKSKFSLCVLEALAFNGNPDQYSTDQRLDDLAALGLTPNLVLSFFGKPHAVATERALLNLLHINYDKQFDTAANQLTQKRIDAWNKHFAELNALYPTDDTKIFSLFIHSAMGLRERLERCNWRSRLEFSTESATPKDYSCAALKQTLKTAQLLAASSAMVHSSHLADLKASTRILALITRRNLAEKTPFIARPLYAAFIEGINWKISLFFWTATTLTFAALGPTIGNLGYVKLPKLPKIGSIGFSVPFATQDACMYLGLLSLGIGLFSVLRKISPSQPRAYGEGRDGEQKKINTPQGAC